MLPGFNVSQDSAARQGGIETVCPELKGPYQADAFFGEGAVGGVGGIVLAEGQEFEHAGRAETLAAGDAERSDQRIDFIAVQQGAHVVGLVD